MVAGLAAGFSRLDDGDEEYLFLTHEAAGGWLEPFMTGPCRRLAAPRSARSRLVRALPALARLYGETLWRPAVPASDGAVEAAGVEVMHFTSQDGFRTRLPSIYHPHDLQHLHRPEFFGRAQRRWREAYYGELCRRAEMVAVASTWVKRDVVERLHLAPGKVEVVPLAPALEPDLRPDPLRGAGLRARLSLPEQFVFLPAQTWPHKNHLGLLEALARVRDRRGATLPLVCSGHLTDHAAVIRARAAQLGLAGSLHLLGFVPPEDLRELYGLARCVVIPTLFEAASFPLWEAFQSGVPAACSNVTSLPEQAGDAALVFDPGDLEAMADAIWRVFTDEDLRLRLVARGRQRVGRLSWARTARLFRAHYRRLAARPLSAGDRELLAAPTTFDSLALRAEGAGDPQGES